MSYDPTGPRTPRSTPIPGGDDPASGFGSPFSHPIPGNLGATAPPTPTEFANGASTAAPPPGMRAFPGMPAPAPGFPGASGFPGGPGSPGDAGFPGGPGGPGMYGMPGMGMPYVAPKRRRSFVGVLFVLVLFAGPVIGVGIGIWAVFKAKDAVDQAGDLSNPDLSDRDREALGLGDDVLTLFDPTAAPAVVAAFEAEIGGSPTRFTQVLLYPDYAFADAQDPAIPTHLDEYSWRSGDVGAPDPEQTDPELESKLFSSADVNWDAIAVLADAAPGLLAVEQGKVTHVIVDRSSFADNLVITRIYVTGPRGSGYVEANALTGEVLAAR